MGFDASKIDKIGFWVVFGGYVRFQNTVMCIFSQTIKILQNPIKMLLEGLKIQFLAFGTFTHARNIIFVKDRLISESHLMIKMCSFSVRNDNICYEHMSVFVNVFKYDTNI